MAGVCFAALGSSAFAATRTANPDPGLIARWQPCAPGAGVTVIVDFESLGDGKVDVGCAEGNQGSGVSALVHAGFTVTGTAQYGDAFICRIDDLPTSSDQSCNGTPPASAYWSYWTATQPGTAWSFSAAGANSPTNHPAKGTFQGWSFSTASGETVPPRIGPTDGGGSPGTTTTTAPTTGAPPPTTEPSTTAGRPSGDTDTSGGAGTAVSPRTGPAGTREPAGSAPGTTSGGAGTTPPVPVAESKASSGAEASVHHEASGVPSDAEGGSGTGSPAALIVGGVVIAVLAGGGGVIAWRRRRRAF